MLIIQKDRYSRADIVHNLRAWYNHDQSNGVEWYNEAFDFCYKLAIKYDITATQAAGIVAALSPQKRWNENKLLAIQFLKTGKAGQYGMLIDKCRRILKISTLTPIEEIADILHGDKIRSFFLNIVTNRDVVTIDRHMICAAVGYSYGTVTAKGYKYLSGVITEMAADLMIMPKTLQAVIWCNYRDVNVRKFEEKVPF
jgi:hypothetical protein